MPGHDVITALETEIFKRQVAAVIDRPIAETSVSADAQIGGVRRVTVQLRSRRARPRRGERWLCHVYLSLTAGGSPAAASGVSVIAGRVVQTITADAEWVIETDGDAKIVLDVSSGAATRYVNVAPIGRVDRSEPITWA